MELILWEAHFNFRIFIQDLFDSLALEQVMLHEDINLHASYRLYATFQFVVRQTIEGNVTNLDSVCLGSPLNSYKQIPLQCEHRLQS